MVYLRHGTDNRVMRTICLQDKKVYLGREIDHVKRAIFIEAIKRYT